MSEPLSIWIPRINAEFPGVLDAGYGRYRSTAFMRDPVRAMQQNSKYFLSPADGIVLYQKVVGIDDAESLDIKGKRYSLRDVLEDNRITGKALVTGIFMTVFDVHVNRVPYSGILSYKTCPPILSANKPMDIEENDILAENMNKLIGDLGGYLKYNARTVNSVYIPELDYRYWIAQIADDDVNVIAPFNPNQAVWVHQGMRFSTVRWGSHVELVCPLDDRYDLVPIANGVSHVTAATDALVRLDRMDKVDTLYVNRPLLNAEEVITWAKSVGFETALPPENMHVTLCYSKTRMDWRKVKPLRNGVIASNSGRSLECFDANAVVLRFESEALEHRNAELLAAGATSEYAEYKPHVTITYSGNNVDLNSITPYEGELRFGIERFRPIDEDWHDSVVEKTKREEV